MKACNFSSASHQVKYHHVAQAIARLRASESSGSLKHVPADEHLRHTYREYDDRLRRSNSLDFDLLVYKAAELLATSPAALSYVRRTYLHVLVDEFQDSDPAQLRLVELLAPPPGATRGADEAEATSVFVVGDSDQSIYGWRGAEMGNTKRFAELYGIAKALTLECNYRSTRSIAAAAQVWHSPHLWINHFGGTRRVDADDDNHPCV